MLVPLEDILAAQRRLAPYLSPSPLYEAQNYRERVGAEVFLKLELLLPTHAFKVRGALNALLSDNDRCAVVTASAGNHGLGLAYAAREVGVAAVVVVPETTPEDRCRAILDLGGDLRVHGRDWNEANSLALRLVEEGYRYVSPFDDPTIMAGQGTIGLELLEQCPDLEVVVCSVGGGGLISGIASALKALKENVRVVGVETEGADCMAQSLRAGQLVELPQFASVAQSLGTKRSTERPFAIVREAVERVAVVSDRASVRELLWTLDHEKILVEPAASCTLAALVGGCVPDIEGRKVAAIMCGGNVTLGQVLTWRERFGFMDSVPPLGVLG